MMMMVSANDLMTLYVGLELQSLALYVIAAMNRDNAKATEAGLKYFVLGALSSGMLLYGASLVYGFTGRPSSTRSRRRSRWGRRSLGLVFGMVFLLAGIAFKISAVPFHMWTPDVYEGAPTPVTAFFADGAEGRGDGAVHPRRYGELRAGRARLAADRHLPLDRLDGARLVRGHRPEQPQAAASPIRRSATWALPWSASRPAPPIGVEGVAVYMAIYMAMTIGFFAASCR